MRRVTRIVALSAGLAILSGCSMVQKYMGGDSQAREQYVTVWVDGHEAVMGDVRCEVSTSVTTSPTLKYAITDPEKIGRVKSVIINIFREFDGGPSSQADFIVVAADTNNPDAQMKPDVDYPLNAPGEYLRFMDGSGNNLDAIVLEKGMTYYMNFVVSADRSETVQVEFTAF